VIEIAADIVRQGAAGLVPPAPVFLQALHHDPVEVAAQHTTQHQRFRLALAGDLDDRGVGCHPGRSDGRRETPWAMMPPERPAAGWGVAAPLRDQPLDLRERRRAQPVTPQGRAAGEQLVQQHPSA